MCAKFHSILASTHWVIAKNCPQIDIIFTWLNTAGTVHVTTYLYTEWPWLLHLKMYQIKILGGRLKWSILLLTNFLENDR